MVTPCNMHIDQLALESEKGANEAGGKAIIFNTITVPDGIPIEERTFAPSSPARCKGPRRICIP